MTVTNLMLGNLVTPSWWTDLWLNEGFASYVEYLGVDAVQPELKLLEQFVVSDLQDVFRTVNQLMSIFTVMPSDFNFFLSKFVKESYLVLILASTSVQD